MGAFKKQPDQVKSPNMGPTPAPVAGQAAAMAKFAKRKVAPKASAAASSKFAKMKGKS